MFLEAVYLQILCLSEMFQSQVLAEDEETKTVGNLLERPVPEQLCGEKAHHRQFSAELLSIFHRSISKTDRSLRAGALSRRGR